MRRTLILAAAVGGLAVSSSAFAAFSLNFTRSSLNATQDAVLVRALNDGVGTGTKISALDLAVSIQTGGSGNKTYFFVDDTDFDGTPDQVQIPNAAGNPTGGFIRIGTAADTFIVAASPNKGVVQPNPWVGGVSSFAVTATTLAAPVANTGTGALIARLIIDKNAGITVGGVIGGDTGAAVTPTGNVLLPVGGGPVNAAPVFGTPATTSSTDVAISVSSDTAATATVNFANKFGTKSFVIRIPVSDDASTTALNLSSSNPLNTTVGGVTITGLSAATAGFIDVTGTYARGAVDATVPVVITATDAGALTDTYTLNFAAVPEPTTLAGIAGLSLLGLRRRAK